MNVSQVKLNSLQLFIFIMLSHLFTSLMPKLIQHKRPENRFRRYYFPLMSESEFLDIMLYSVREIKGLCIIHKKKLQKMYYVRK